MRIEWKPFHFVYGGRLENGKLTGTWRQAGITWLLDFERAKEVLPQVETEAKAAVEVAGFSRNKSFLPRLQQAQKAGDLASAEKICRQELEFRQITDPSNTLTITLVLGDLATVLLHENKLTEAEGVYRERLALLQSSPAGNEDRIVSTLKTLTDILKKEGKTNAIAALSPPTSPAKISPSP